MIAVGSITAYPAPKDGIDGISIKGDTGLTGLSIRNTEWIAGVYYRNDTSITATERYLDYAIIVGSGDFQDGVGTNYSIYQAKAAHNGVISSATNKPGTGTNWGTYWEKINVLKPVFTPILLASLIKASQIDVDNVIADGIFGKELDVQDAVISNLTVINATVTGTIYANAGRIGGFEIGSGRIGSVASADGSGGSLAIYSNFFRVGGSSGYVLFGDNVIPATAGGAFNATGRIVNQTYNQGAGWGFDACNTGLYISVSGGTKNFGIDSNAALKAPAFINTKVKYLVFGTSYSIDLSQYSIFMCYAASDKNVIMPDEASIAKQFSLSSLPSDFGCIFTFHVIEGSSTIILNNVIDWNTTPINLKLLQGDSVQLLVTKFPNFHYQIINHTD